MKEKTCILIKSWNERKSVSQLMIKNLKYKMKKITNVIADCERLIKLYQKGKTRKKCRTYKSKLDIFCVESQAHLGTKLRVHLKHFTKKLIFFF